MKNLTHSAAAIALAIALIGTQVHASNATYNILSDSAWQEIETSTELEALAEIDELPVLQVTSDNSLNLDLKAGNFTNLLLDAPFNENDQVGIVIFDSKGAMVHSATGEYGELKDLHFKDYYNYDMTYVVKIYSDVRVYEAKVQVVYR